MATQFKKGDLVRHVKTSEIGTVEGIVNPDYIHPHTGKTEVLVAVSFNGQCARYLGSDLEATSTTAENEELDAEAGSVSPLAGPNLPIMRVLCNGKAYQVSDRVRHRTGGHVGTINGLWFDGMDWLAAVQFDDHMKAEGHNGPSSIYLNDLHLITPGVDPHWFRGVDFAKVGDASRTMRVMLGIDDEARLRKRVEELEKELEITAVALCSTRDDLQQARQVIQALLITATCTDLPTADAAAVRQAVMFLGGTSE